MGGSVGFLETIHFFGGGRGALSLPQAVAFAGSSTKSSNRSPIWVLTTLLNFLKNPTTPPALQQKPASTTRLQKWFIYTPISVTQTTTISPEKSKVLGSVR